MIESPEFFILVKQWIAEGRVSLEAGDLAAVARCLFRIKGTAAVFGYNQIAYITGLGEQIAYYATGQLSASHRRKYHGCIWDILTTIDFMIANGLDQTNDEQNILLFRVEATLKTLGDFRPQLTQTEIDIIVRSNESVRQAARENI